MRRRRRPVTRTWTEAQSAPGPWVAWENVIRFFAFPPEVRRIIYTTSAIESLHMQLREIIETRRYFPSDDAALESSWLAQRKIFAGKVRPADAWKAAMNQLAIMYGERFTRVRA